MSERQRVTFGPFTGGINRAVAQERLGTQELWEACGVYQDERGALAGCFETEIGTLDVTFVNSAETTGSYYDNRTTPLRVIYWADEGKVWQLLGQNDSGTTSVRRQDLDRSYADYDCTAAVYRGLLFLCGSGETAFALSTTWSCNVRVAGTTFSYSSASGVVSSPTFTSGSGYNLLAGDVFVVSGSRYAIASVTQSSGAFTISTGSTFSTGDFYLERVRPIYLAESYSEQDGVATMVYGQTTFSSTTNAGLATNSYIAFSVASTWSMADSKFHPRSYQISSFTGSGASWTVTLTDAYEGTAGTASYRVSGTGLSIALPFVYQDRLCAVGASSTNSDYNVIYNSGYPGQASPTVKDDDIFDFMYWDLTNTAYPIGLNAGAIQRVEPLADRAVVFCQNAVYEWRGVLPVDALLGSSMQDRPIAPGIGATTYDSVAVGPDGQTIYFASPDGLYRLYGFTVEPIDAKIRNHEMYTTAMEAAAYWDNRVYFSQGEDTEVQSYNHEARGRNTREQFNAIWIYDLLNQSWTYTQRVHVPTDGGLYMLYAFGLPGGLFNPYRGDLTQTEKLFVSRPGGLVKMNDRASFRDARIYHAQTAMTGNVDNGDGSPKKIQRVYVDAGSWTLTGSEGAPQISIVAPVDISPDDDTPFTSGVNPAPTVRPGSTRYVRNGVGAAFSSPRVGVCVGSFRDVDRIGNEADTEDTNGIVNNDFANSLGVAQSFTASSLTGHPSGYNAVNKVVFLCGTQDRPTAMPTVTLHSDSSGSIGATLTTFTVNTTTVYNNPENTGFYYFRWLEAYSTTTTTLTESTRFWVVIHNPSATTISVAGESVSGASCVYVNSGNSITSTLSDSQLRVRLVHEIGRPTATTQIDGITVDYTPLPGRKR